MFQQGVFNPPAPPVSSDMRPAIPLPRDTTEPPALPVQQPPPKAQTVYPAYKPPPPVKNKALLAASRSSPKSSTVQPPKRVDTVAETETVAPVFPEKLDFSKEIFLEPPHVSRKFETIVNFSKQERNTHSRALLLATCSRRYSHRRRFFNNLRFISIFLQLPTNEFLICSLTFSNEFLICSDSFLIRRMIYTTLDIIETITQLALQIMQSRKEIVRQLRL